jgi:hypothetical protein
VPGYEILGELSRGGMGVVFKARQVSLKRVVALKMLRDGVLAGPGELARFRREAEAVARLQHPHVVQIHEIGEAEGRPFFSLEYVEGGSLAQKLGGTPLPSRQAALLAEPLARAVHAAHQRGIIHRDLKPANVLLTADGQPKITDFGLARHLDADPGQTPSGAVVGTPSYMAPEQAGGKARQAGPAADVYALGAILYELLTGRPPFRAATPLDTVLQVMSEEPVPPSRLQPKVARDLETICLKCLNKEPDRRYASAADLADDLHRYLGGQPIRARPTPVWRRALKWAKRRPALAALGVVSAAAGLALVGVLLGFNAALRHERDRFREQRDLADKNRQIAEAQRARAEAAQRMALLALLREGVTALRQEGDDLLALFRAGRTTSPGLLRSIRGQAEAELQLRQDPGKRLQVLANTLRTFQQVEEIATQLRKEVRLTVWDMEAVRAARLGAEIALLRARGRTAEGAQEPDRLPTLLGERVQALRREVENRLAVFRAGREDIPVLLESLRQLAEAEAELGDDRQQRIAAHEKAVATFRDVEEAASKLRDASRITRPDLARVTVARAEAELALLQAWGRGEEGKPKGTVPPP